MALIFSAGFFLSSFAQEQDSLEISEENLVCFQVSADQIQCFVLPPDQVPDDQMETEDQPFEFEGEEDMNQGDTQEPEFNPHHEEPSREEMEIFKREPYFETEEDYDEDWT